MAVVSQGASRVASEEAGVGVRDFCLPAEAGAQIPPVAWQTAARLLTTLDAEQVIDLFAHQLRRQLPYHSLLYQHDEQGIVYSDGVAARHVVSYRLFFGERGLGVLTLTRRRRFTGEELARLEAWICGLLYALRNALQYREAFEHPL